MCTRLLLSSGSLFGVVMGESRGGGRYREAALRLLTWISRAPYAMGNRARYGV